jgi:hypothetical protein
VINSGSLRPYLQALNYAGQAARDKHSSLLQSLVNDGHKKFYNLGPPEAKNEKRK